MWGSEGIVPPFLTSALDKGKWSASSLGRYTPVERATGIHYIRGWTGLRDGLDAVDNPGLASLSMSLYRLS
jgi:hypothetical protein